MSDFNKPPRPSLAPYLPMSQVYPPPLVPGFTNPPSAPPSAATTASTSTPAEPAAIIQNLETLLNRAAKWSQNPKLTPGQAFQWINGVRFQLQKMYGRGAKEIEHFPGTNPQQALKVFPERFRQLQHFVKELRTLPQSSREALSREAIFIGHGRSPLWRELKDFIADRLNLPWDEFNHDSAAGITTSEKLDAMRAKACFALLIMTAEEERVDTTMHARPNVVHEVGLFQGTLGRRRAIVLLEEGCSEFSNMVGLTQIRFPRGHISACFEEIRRVLEREGVCARP